MGIEDEQKRSYLLFPPQTTKSIELFFLVFSENHPPINTVGLVKVKTFKLRPGVVSYRDGTSQAI